MSSSKKLVFFILTVILFACQAFSREKPLYRNPKEPVEKRVDDLIARMTLEEKIAQLGSVTFGEIMDGERMSAEKMKKYLANGIGAFKNHPGAVDPGYLNDMQKFVTEKTRLGIPVIVQEEALHGCVAKFSTVFPQSIGLASTWDPELVRRVAAAIGRESRARGIHQALAPVVNIAGDPRCGGTEESYGEDPCLTSRIAVAYVEGIQSQKVAATVKHFAANFVGNGGRDSYPVNLSERILREIYFPAFKACVAEAGAMSVMAAYNSLDGVPCTCNKWLLTDILRKEWGFRGTVVSDYHAVRDLEVKHNVAGDKSEAADRALEAGLDMELPVTDCYASLVSLVKEGKVSEDTVNDSVRRVLKIKFQLGLFENPYPDLKTAKKVINCDEHRKLALEAARKSIVLLKNDNVLPLKKDLKIIAVIGPNGNVVRLGGYSGFQENLLTPFDAIKNKVSSKTDVLLVEGCSVAGNSSEKIPDAIEVARAADVVLAFAGNYSEWNDGTEGEGRDRCGLDLPGFQESLIIELCNSGTPVVVILENGSAVTMTKWANRVKAIVEAWYPGQEGAQAIADVLFGDYNPGGKLPITFPRQAGQLPLYYNHEPSGRADDYVDSRGNIMFFPFGYGLSYTKFAYSGLKTAVRKNKIDFNLSVENTGAMEGDEVVQLFIQNKASRVARPVKELKGFKRITLKPRETKEVSFSLSNSDFSYLDEKMRTVVEPGTYRVMVGTITAEFELNK